MKAAEVTTKGPVDTLTVKIISKDEPRSVRGGDMRVCECTTEDASGRITVTLWNDDIAKYEVGDTITISKGWASEFQGKVSVSSGKFGQIEKAEK